MNEAMPARGERMTITTGERKEALAAAVEQEMASLQARGVRVSGNAFSPVLLVKGELNVDERQGAELLSAADGRALRAALSAIGWEPQDFCTLATVFGEADPSIADCPQAGEPLPVDMLREAVEALDPEAIVLLDNAAADALRETYADALAIIEDFDTAMLKPGLVAPCSVVACWPSTALRPRLPTLRKKQRMWAYLKQLTPLGAPY